MLKKLSLHAGHESMMRSASLRFLLKASTCSSSQQTAVSFHLFPQSSTSFSFTSAAGSSAFPLSRHGKLPPKNDCFPQLPRIAQRPASCMGVKRSPLTSERRPSRGARRLRVMAVCELAVPDFLVLKMASWFLDAVGW